ncbi:hypothetical protein EG327_010627, partial [Venturia inaequalis]
MHTLSPTTLLSLALLTLTLTLPHPSTALTLRNTPAPPKPKCGDLDNAFWEMMHRYEFCEVIKKLPKRPQCGEGRKKCGVPGSHCTEEGVCSTACGVGRPECPRGFRCENGECEDFEEEGEGGSREGGSKDGGSKDGGSKDGGNKDGANKDTAKASTGTEGAPKTDKPPTNCIEAKEQTGCSCPPGGKCECHFLIQSVADGPCIDAPQQQQRRNHSIPAIPAIAKAPQKPKSAGLLPDIIGISGKNNDGTATGSLKKPWAKAKAKPQGPVVPITRPQISSSSLEAEREGVEGTGKYRFCSIGGGRDTACRSGGGKCIRRPNLECDGANLECVRRAGDVGICVA